MGDYAITITAMHNGWVTASSSDGHAFRTTIPLLEGARYWQGAGADRNALITTVYSSGDGNWALRTTVGVAAQLRVTTRHGRPVFALTEGGSGAEDNEI